MKKIHDIKSFYGQEYSVLGTKFLISAEGEVTTKTGQKLGNLEEILEDGLCVIQLIEACEDVCLEPPSIL